MGTSLKHLSIYFLSISFIRFIHFISSITFVSSICSCIRSFHFVGVMEREVSDVALSLPFTIRVMLGCPTATKVFSCLGSVTKVLFCLRMSQMFFPYSKRHECVLFSSYLTKETW